MSVYEKKKKRNETEPILPKFRSLYDSILLIDKHGPLLPESIPNTQSGHHKAENVNMETMETKRSMSEFPHSTESIRLPLDGKKGKFIQTFERHPLFCRPENSFEEKPIKSRTLT